MPNLEKTAAQNELLTNKMMAVLVIACAYMMLIMGIRWGYQSESFPLFYAATKILLFAALIGFAFGIIYEVIDRKRGVNTAEKLFSGAFIAAAAALLGYICYRMAYTDIAAATKFLYVLIPAVGALYLIHVIYRREFFLIAFTGVLIALYIWQYARYAAGSVGFFICQILLLLSVGAEITGLIWMEHTGGTVTIRGVRYRFLPEDSTLKPAIVGMCVFFMLSAALFLIPANLFMYFAYVSVALVFFFAVYYTVLML